MPTEQVVPEDFPSGPCTVSIAGAHPKLAVRRIGGTYRVGLTDEELQERYGACEDLAQQLASYCVRKELENPSWTREHTVARVGEGVAQKVTAGLWNLSAAEQRWVMVRVQQVLGW